MSEGHVVWPPNHDWQNAGFETRQIHSGELEEGEFGARITPMYLTNAFRFDSFEQSQERFAGTDIGQSYSRSHNPTNDVGERRIADLEGGTGAVAVASGQAAITAVVLALADTGEHFVSQASIYSGTRTLFTRTFGRLGVEVDFVGDPGSEAAWDTAIRSNTKFLYVETIPNPKSDLVDFEVIRRVAERHRIPVVVDNTIATPYLFRPLEHGADIVVHSATKFLTGQGAAISGLVIDGGRYDWENSPRRYPLLTDRPASGAPSFVERYGREHAFEKYLRNAVVNDIGPALSPFNGFLLQQGMETLSLRMERHVENAQAIAEWLEVQNEVESVDHAGLPSSPSFEVAQRDFGGRGGSVFAVTVAGGQAGAEVFIDRLQLFSRMTNIGDVRSMVLHPATTTHLTFTDELRASLGIHPGLVRLSIGLESLPDLLADLTLGLAAVSAAGFRTAAQAE
jgi:O-acetylhomoserine (thiol)-lyase